MSRRWAAAAPGRETASPADAPVAKATPGGIAARGAAGRSRQAGRPAAGVFDQAGAAAAAMHRLQAARAVWRPDGPLQERAGAQQPLRDPSSEMGGEAGGQGRRWLQDPRTLHPWDWRQGQLAQAVPDPLRREAVTR